MFEDVQTCLTIASILKKLNHHQHERHEKQSNLKLDYQDLAIKNVPTQKQMILSSSNCNTSNSSHHNTHYHRSNHYTQRCILIIFRPVKYIKCFHISCKLFDKNIQDRANAMKMGRHKLDRIWQWIVVKICRHGKEGKKLEKIKKVFYGSSLIYHHL